MMTILALSFASYLFALYKRQFLYPGLLLQVAYIISRGIELQRLPLVGPHDTLVFLSASIAAFSIPFASLLKNRKLFFNIVTVTTAIFTVFVMISKKHNAPLPPVLKTFWFECHVVLAFMSYALFGVAAILGYLYLREKENSLEGLQYRAALIGYCLFTLSMIFGGIWAYLAWGTYWMWTPKELWTSILWMFYSFYLHARLRQWWMGKPMAYLGIAGFLITMFTYLGVSLLMKSSHSF
ncbi:MAG: cytochrome c biogenesis protein CcsA [Nitrospirae bacterium]|nr:cytochrome c biogenesis protein CcsA [Nitrospirota bacterium]